MSPEQAELTSLDIDTRTDVYSLGVLLYQLLAGALPFSSRELRKAGFDEIRRKIREDDPPKPSVRLSTLSGERTSETAKSRHTDPSGLRRQLQGDLDWITMRALEKDRTRRYGSPNELAADVQRHLADEPVLAGPPSAAYRSRKFVRRHRMGVAFAATVLLALVAFSVTVTLQASRIARERDRANDEAETANRVSEFMTDLFAIPDPGESRGNEITAREVLDKGAKDIERGLEDEPLIQARLMTTMGKTYRNLGSLDPAGVLLEQALAIREENAESNPSELADNLIVLSWLDYERSRGMQAEGLDTFARALEYAERGLAIRRAQPDADPVDVSWNLTLVAWCEFQLHRKEAAGEHWYEAEAILQQYPDTSDWRAAVNAEGLAYFLHDQEKVDQAVEQVLKSVEIFDRAQERGDYWPPILPVLQDAGRILWFVERWDEAEDFFQRAVERNERLYGPNHYLVAEVLASLSKLRLDQDDLEGAYEYRRRVMEIREADPDLARSPGLLGGRIQLAHLLMRLGRSAEARVQYGGAIDLFNDGVKTAPRETPIGVEQNHELAMLVAEAGHREDALRLFEMALLVARECQPVSHCPILQAAIHRDWAELLHRMSRDTEANEHEALAAGLVADAADAVAAGN